VFDIITVGHLSIDSIILPERHTPFMVLGGSPTYVSFAARRLDSTVSIISKIGTDFPVAYRWWLGQEGINLSNIIEDKNCLTTRFEIEYNSDLSDRILRSKNRALPITVEDLPKSMKAKAIHIAPIDGEVSYEVAEKLKSCAEVLSLDAQGLVRNFDENGNVNYAPLTDMRILDCISIYKSSKRELEAVTGIQEIDLAIKAIHDHGAKIVIITLGSQGSTLSTEGAQYSVPSCPPAKFVDPTGAGDAFVGGFLTEYVYGENLFRCACVGSASASLVVEGIGPTFFGEKETIYERARALYEKEIKA
jgi:sugar/nucleoside kinase (ribokinase family)